MKNAIDELLSGTPLTAVELVGCQEGSVVSRELVRKKAGSVTLFAFSKGQGLSEHTAPFDALVFILEGEAEISISGKPRKAVSGQMIVMPADEPHAVTAHRDFKMMLIMIKAE